MAYAFGFRKSELLTMRVAQVDLANRTVSLYRGRTKNKEPRQVKLTHDTYTLLQVCVHGKTPTDYVFTRGNVRVRDFRGAWDKLCKAAGLDGLIFHDLRRSAVRNMIRRGIPEIVAMRISGHKTRSVFDRYNIVSENDLADAALKLENGGRENRYSLDTIAPEVGGALELSN